MLRADTSGIADEDGLENAVFGYHGLPTSEISGATAATHTLVASDEGKTIRVLSFTDDAGNVETLTSAATAEVEPEPNRPATGAPSVSGTAQVGEMLRADTSGIVDEDGLRDVRSSATGGLPTTGRHRHIGVCDGLYLQLADGDEGNHQGAGELHRRCRQRGITHQRGDGSGGRQAQ